jgi:hypothetical protein
MTKRQHVWALSYLLGGVIGSTQVRTVERWSRRFVLVLHNRMLPAAATADAMR